MTPKFETWAATMMPMFSSEMGNTEKKWVKGEMFDYEIDLEHNECEMSLKYPRWDPHRDSSLFIQEMQACPVIW